MASRINNIGNKVTHRTTQTGFTLLETLVALAILAIAMSAVMRATGASTNHAEIMRAHLIAGWVAQNRLALHAARNDWLPIGSQEWEETQAGMRLLWQENISATPNPGFRRIEVTVARPDDPKYVLRRLSGFLHH